MKQQSRSLSRGLRRARARSNELDKNLEVAGVKILSVFDSLGRLQNHRQIAKTGIVDQVPKGFQPHLPRPDSRRGGRRGYPLATTVVQMPHAQASQPHGPAEPIDRFIVLLSVSIE